MTDRERWAGKCREMARGMQQAMQALTDGTYDEHFVLRQRDELDDVLRPAYEALLRARDAAENAEYHETTHHAEMRRYNSAGEAESGRTARA